MNKPEIVGHLSRPAQLRRLLNSAGIEFIMEAHNGVSARIVQEAGFAGIWASGLALSAQFGVRDSNEASWTQIVDMLEFMSDATEIPILLDGDTGYGNFNNLRRLIKKLEQRGIAGVCIEDKLFPKTNSFLSGERQPLATADEFCGKIKAGKDCQSDADFCVIARVEALIAGWGMAEALKRAAAYREAGADAILIHSKLARADEIVAFAKEWAQRAPLVIVPTKYYSTPTDVYRQARVSLVIWANHMVRAAVDAMQNVARAVHDAQSLVEVEDRIAPVEEIFRLQGAAELAAAERCYIGRDRVETRAVILAASRGQELHTLTETRPKVMLPIAGKPILRRQVDELKKQGINDITVVAGYRADSIDVTGINLVINREHARTGELASLVCAQPWLETDSDNVILYGDLLFRGYILRDLLDSEEELVVIVDSAFGEATSAGRPATGAPDYAYCTAADNRAMLAQNVQLFAISPDRDGELGEANGRWIGMLRVRGAGRQWLLEALAELELRDDFAQLSMRTLLNRIVANGHPIRVLYIHGHWLDVNALEDLDNAGDFAQGRG